MCKRSNHTAISKVATRLCRIPGGPCRTGTSDCRLEDDCAGASLFSTLFRLLPTSTLQSESVHINATVVNTSGSKQRPEVDWPSMSHGTLTVLRGSGCRIDSRTRIIIELFHEYDSFTLSLFMWLQLPTGSSHHSTPSSSLGPVGGCRGHGVRLPFATHPEPLSPL